MPNTFSKSVDVQKWQELPQGCQAVSERDQRREWHPRSSLGCGTSIPCGKSMMPKDLASSAELPFFDNSQHQNQTGTHPRGLIIVLRTSYKQGELSGGGCCLLERQVPTSGLYGGGGMWGPLASLLLLSQSLLFSSCFLRGPKSTLSFNGFARRTHKIQKPCDSDGLLQQKDTC